MQAILTFKIEHGDFSATITLPANYTLEILAESILDAVGFDRDHAYGFHDNLKNPYRSKEQYTVFADMGEGVAESDTGVCETKISSVFKPKKKMLFHFDYGADWCFLVTCLKMEETDRPLRKARILDRKGTPPVQYPDCEEE
jgi:hypothetical protein